MSHAPISRRRFVQGISAAALASAGVTAVGGRNVQAAGRQGSGPAAPGPRASERAAPKICMGISSRASEADMRRITQLGVEHVLMGGPPIPWEASALRETMDRFKAGGLTVCNMMIGGFPNTIYGRPGRDEEIAKVKASIAAAGQAGLPVVEYNFYAHRAMEGYYEVIGRAGAGYTGFDYERMKDLPPLPEEGARTLDEMWANITYFLKEVIPVAEQSGVRLALHPNDPPTDETMGGIPCLIHSFEDYERAYALANSPNLGMEFCCGCWLEGGAAFGDMLKAIRYYTEQKRIFIVHFRNVTSTLPVFTETFLDNGYMNMYTVMKTFVEAGYDGSMIFDHTPKFVGDFAKGAGPGYALGYMRALLERAEAELSA